MQLHTTTLENQKVIGVDLGLTNSAVCSCIDKDGTVIDRLFINQSKEKDQLKRKLNKLAKAKRKSGILHEKPNYWRRINGLQKFIIQDTVNQIVAFALKNKADVIVLEYLGKMKLPKGFGKNYFTLSAITATVNQIALHAKISRINNFHLLELKRDALEELEEEKELTTLCLLDTKPCHCNKHFLKYTRKTLKLYYNQKFFFNYFKNLNNCSPPFFIFYLILQ